MDMFPNSVQMYMCVYESQGLKRLRRLYLDGNLLEAVPSGLPPTLQELKISENRLRGIHEHSLQGLIQLYILTSATRKQTFQLLVLSQSVARCCSVTGTI